MWLPFLAELWGQRCQAVLISNDLMPEDEDLASCLPRACQEGLNESCSEIKLGPQGGLYHSKVAETVKPGGRAELRLWPNLMHGRLSTGIDPPVWEDLSGRKMREMALNILLSPWLPKLY